MSLFNLHAGRQTSSYLSLLILLTLTTLAVAQPEAGDERAIAVPVSDKLVDFFSGSTPSSIDELEAAQAHVRELAETVQKTVVGVGVGAAQGSGVIISRDGYVLTAAHVSGRPGRMARLFLSDGRMVPARTLGLNKTFDAGLMKIAIDD